MSKHTPGPWRARIIPIHQDTIPIEATDAEALVARVNGFPKTPAYAGSGTDDPNANARLIAAAPDLLEALQALMGTCCHLIAWERKWPNVVAKCKAAVAKAVGE